MNVDPRGMDVMDWTETMVLPLSRYLVVPRLLRPEGWRDWANSVIQVSAIAAFKPPQPDRFEDWKDWAYHFILAVRT